MLTNIDKFKTHGIVRSKFQTGEVDSILFLMKHYNQSTPQSIIRFLITHEYQKVKETQLKYASAAPRERYADKIRAIKAMGEDELTAYFYEIGVFKDGFLSGTTDVKVSYRMAKTENSMSEMVKYIYPNPEYNTENEGRNLDQIINKITKEKLI